MTTALRGQATGRFYKAFHAWSRLGNAHQRRCFTATNLVNEANDAHPSRLTTEQDDQESLLTTEQDDQEKGRFSKRDARVAELGYTPKSVGRIEIPQERLTRILEHPHFLNKLQAVYGTTIEHVTELREDQSRPSDVRVIRVITPERRIWTKVKTILRLANPADYDFDKPFSSLANRENANELKSKVSIPYHMPRRMLGLLVDNNSELITKIQDKFGARIRIMNREGIKRSRIAISGDRVAANQALDFIKSIEYPIEQPAPAPLKASEIKEAYRAAMRSVPSSVVVLTTHDTSSGGKVTLDSIRGMTVSSMTSVTLEPEPIVSFSIRGPSRTLDCITQGHPFYVNFLSDTREGALIADQFARYHEDPSQPFRTLEEQNLTSISPHMDSRGPYFKGNFNPAYLKCELLPGKTLEVGDHTVIFARVMHLWASPRIHIQRLTFLAYAQTQYRMLVRSGIELSPLEVSDAQSQPQASEDSQAPRGPTAAEIEEAKTAQEFNDKYWSMAIDEGEEEDSVLEERAADQRAVGDAEKPLDFDKK